jgi:hypothetical protein
MNPYGRYLRWRRRAPPWEAALVSGSVYGLLMTMVLGRGESWLSIGLGTGSGVAVGIWDWFHTRRGRRRRQVPPRPD